MNERRQSCLALAILVLLPLIWLWPCVFGGKTFVPFDPARFPPAALTMTDEQRAAADADANLQVTEVWPWLLPEMELAQQAVARGELPQWNPHARTGTPLHEPGVLGVFYPPHWLWLLGGDPKSWLAYLTWISVALAGLFTFGLLRQVALSPFAAFFGAATFELSGAIAANGYFFTRLPALAWLPALLWALLRLGEGDRLKPGALAAVAVAVAMPWCAGFPPYAAAGLVIAALLALRLLLERAGRAGDRACLRLAVRLGFGVALGLLLAMPQLLPMSWFYAYDAARGANPGFQSAIANRFEVYGLIGYLTPDAYGHPIAAAELGRNPLCYLWGNITRPDGGPGEPNFNYTEYSVFAGTFALLLAGFGVLRGKGHMRGFATVTLAILLGLALLLPVMNWFYHLPLIKNVQPMRWLAPATLLLAWLAAIGTDSIAKVTRPAVLRLAIVTLVLAGAVLYLTRQPAAWHAADPTWPAAAVAERFDIPVADATAHIGRPAFPLAVEQFEAAGHAAGMWLLLCGALLLLYAAARPEALRRRILLTLPLTAIVQLGMHGQSLLRGHELAVGTDTGVHEFLRERAAEASERGGFTVVRASREPAIAIQLPPGQLIAPGIRDLSFYNHGDARSIAPLEQLLDPKNARARLGYLTTALPAAHLNHPLLDLLGVRYVLSFATPGNPPPTNAGRRVGPRLERGPFEFCIHERPDPLPRGFSVPGVEHYDSDAAVVAAMIDPQADFAAAALVVATGDPPAKVAGPRRTVRFVRDDPTVVELDIAAGAHPYLVLTDAWLPGWSATVDGEPVAIARCNHGQRLVALPETACRVRFEFDSPLLGYGFALFGLAAAALLAAFAFRR